MALHLWGELDDDELLVEEDVLEGDSLENGGQIGAFAQVQQQLVAAKHLYHLHAGLVFCLVEGCAEHKLDGCAATKGEEYIGADDTVDGDVYAH